MPNTYLMPLLALGFTVIVVGFVLLFALAYQRHGPFTSVDPAADGSVRPFPEEWPTVPGRLMARIVRPPPAPKRRKNSYTLTAHGMVQNSPTRNLQVDAVYLVNGQSYTTPLLAPMELIHLRAQYSLEELDRQFSLDTEIRVRHDPTNPQLAQVVRTSLPLSLQQLLEQARTV